MVVRFSARIDTSYNQLNILKVNYYAFDVENYVYGFIWIKMLGDKNNFEPAEQGLTFKRFDWSQITIFLWHQRRQNILHCPLGGSDLEGDKHSELWDDNSLLEYLNVLVSKTTFVHICICNTPVWKIHTVTNEEPPIIGEPNII